MLVSQPEGFNSVARLQWETLKLTVSVWLTTCCGVMRLFACGNVFYIVMLKICSVHALV